jgi:hypothetical protein
MDVFPSAARYDYRITNAFSKPLARSLGDTRTEATRKEILDPENVARVRRELEGMRYVILCGDRAAYLRTKLIEAGLNIICCSHTSDQGLVAIHNASAKHGATPKARKELRIRAWADSVLREMEGRARS